MRKVCVDEIRRQAEKVHQIGYKIGTQIGYTIGKQIGDQAPGPGLPGLG